MRLSHGNRASCKVGVPVFVFRSFWPGNLIAGPLSRPFRPGESNRRLSVRTPSDCSIGHALAAWQAGILQSKGSRFCMLLLPTKGSYRRSIIQTLPTGRVQSLAQRPAPLRPQYRPCACRIAIGHPAKSECPILYAILPTEEANRRLSVQPPSGRSIGHALAA